MEELVLLRIDIFEKLQCILRDAARHRVNRNAAKIQIQIINNQLDNTNKTLLHRQDQFSQLTNITQSKKKEWELQCSQCKSHISAMEKHVEEIETTLNGLRARLFPTIVNDMLSSAKEDLDQVNGSLEKLNEIVSSVHDGFIAVTDMVPENPFHIFLNFDDASSPEARLKKAIFDNDTDTTTICAVASGMGGVGKTCALRAIGNHKNAIERFPDGVLYMSLGSEATLDDLICNLADFVRCSGGEKECSEIENEKKLEPATRKVAKWFHGRNCLFLVDDIWRQKGIPPAVTQIMKKILSHEQGRMAFTTRDQDLDCDVSVPFEKRKFPDAERMLMHAADIRLQKPPKEAMASIMSLIEISGGIPIALHAIGSRARNMLKRRKGVDSTSVWEVVSEEYKSAKSTFPMTISNEEKNEPVLNTLYLSVKMMGDRSAEDRTDTLFRAFCVIKKRQQVPTHILTRLWGMSDVEARNQINKFERFSIVEISRCSVGGIAGNYFVVHDLLLDMSKHLAEADAGFTERVSKQLISSYVGDFNLQCEEGVHMQNNPPSSSHAPKAMKRQTSGAEVSFSECWIALSDDGFVHSNGFRLLGLANMKPAGISLLRDPRWINKQLKMCGWKQVENDILVILGHGDGDTQRSCKTKEETFLKMLRATVVESGQLIANTHIAGVVWTQLYGRLWHYKSCDVVSQFLNDIKKYATRPWYMSEGGLPSPKQSVKRVFHPGHRVEMIRDNGNVLEMCVIHPDEKYVSLHGYSEEVDDVKEHRRWTIPVGIDITDWTTGEICSKTDHLFALGKEGTLVVYHDSHRKTEGLEEIPAILRYGNVKITCIAVNRAGSMLVSGDEDSNVNIWKCADSAWKPTMLQPHEGAVKGVAISDDDQLIASASSDCTIRVWSFPYGQVSPSILNSDSGMVICVSFMKGGNSIVSGTWGGTVTVWTLFDTVWKAAQLHGHTAGVICVQLSEGGSFIASGSLDKTVRVWGEQNGTWKTTAIMNHDSSVMRVSISENKKRVASACVDGTVTIHELGGENWDTEQIDGHDGWMDCYAGSNSGKRFASGGTDGKVRVWDWTGHAWRSIILDAPCAWVWKVSFSVDGRKLLAEDLDDAFVCYVEKDGEWTRADNEYDSKFEACGDFDFLEREEWPGGFQKIDGWIRMWKLSSHYFGVLMQHKPNVSYVKLIE